MPRTMRIKTATLFISFLKGSCSDFTTDTLAIIKDRLRLPHPSRAFREWMGDLTSSETRKRSLVLNRFVRNLEAFVDDGKRLAQLLLVDAQRRIRIESIPAHQRVKPLLAEEAPKRAHFVGRAVKRSHWLTRLAAANKLYDAEQTDRPHRSDRGMFSLQLSPQLFHDRSHLLRVGDQIVLFINANRGQRRRAS